jgi:hypothetical protein
MHKRLVRYNAQCYIVFIVRHNAQNVKVKIGVKEMNLDSAVEIMKIGSSPYLERILAKNIIHQFGECLIFLRSNVSMG